MDTRRTRQRTRSKRTSSGKSSRCSKAEYAISTALSSRDEAPPGDRLRAHGGILRVCAGAAVHAARSERHERSLAQSDSRRARRHQGELHRIRHVADVEGNAARPMLMTYEP